MHMFSSLLRRVSSNISMCVLNTYCVPGLALGSGESWKYLSYSLVSHHPQLYQRWGYKDNTVRQSASRRKDKLNLKDRMKTDKEDSLLK